MTSLNAIEEKEEQEEEDSKSKHIKLGIPTDVRKYEMNSPLKYLWPIVSVLASGFLRGLFGVGGPPMIVYFLATDVDRRVVRALVPLSTGFGSGIPLIVNLLWIKGQFDESRWPTYLSMFLSFVAGLLIGNAVHRFVDQKLFRMALLFILLCGSVNLLLVDLGPVSMWSSFVLMIVFVALLVLLALKMIITRLRAPATQS